jgi:hypothetical protein
MWSINNPSPLSIDGENQVGKTQVILSGQPYRLFIESLRTQKTKETYAASLKAFMLFRKFSSVEALISEEVKVAQSHIIDFIVTQKNNGLRTAFTTYLMVVTCRAMIICLVKQEPI